MSGAAERGDLALPPLREDLRLVDGASAGSRREQWLLYDPIQHRYVQIDRKTFELFSLWPRAETAAGLRRLYEARSGMPAGAAEIEALVRFADESGLLTRPLVGAWRTLWEKRKRSRGSALSQVLHNYLFFRVPLVRPDAFLRRTLPLVAPFFSRGAALAVALMGLLGLYLVSRTWDAFLSTAASLFTLEGAVLFGVCLAAVKCLHELGHAYTAARYGCRVPSMGVAVILLAPLLYTDVTDAWRLSSRRQRFAVAAAGIAVELGLACVATLAFALLPAGAMRDVAFIVATTGWVMSLLVNLNPFMRFDGYYMLSDALGMENLQDRAMAFGRWRLRELLFGLGAEPPEPLAPAVVRALWIYAWGLWLYRLALFTAIALIVYHFFFKVLGIFLFVVEILYFIAWPVMREVREWARLAPQLMRSGRALVTAALTLAAMLALGVPWSTRVEVPAVLDVRELAQVFPRQGGRISKVRVRAGDWVAAGAVLIEMESDELSHRISVAEARLALNRMRLGRRAADATDRGQTLVLERERRSIFRELQGLRAEYDELMVCSPIAGRVLELNAELREGLSLGRQDLIAVVGNGAGHALRGYLREDDLARVAPGTRGRFIPDDIQLKSSEVTLTDIATAAATTIEVAALAAPYGGPIAVDEDAEGRLTPQAGRYPVRLEGTAAGQRLPQARRGLVVLDGTPASLLGGLWRHAAGVLVRESGF